VTLRVAERRAVVDEKLTLLKGEIDDDLQRARSMIERELADQKARLDNKAVFAAERVAHELMMDKEWCWRSFKIIKHHLGGFEDDELRKILVRAGAIRVTSSSGEEMWGLLDRNREGIGVERLSPGAEGERYRWGEAGQEVIQNFDPTRNEEPTGGFGPTGGFRV
jgi:hypothetical protein